MSEVNVFTFERGETMLFIVGTEKQALDWIGWFTDSEPVSKRPRLSVIQDRDAIMRIRYCTLLAETGNCSYSDNFDEALIRAWESYHAAHRKR